MTRRARRWWPRVLIAALVLMLAGLAIVHSPAHHRIEHAASCPGGPPHPECADDVALDSAAPAPAPVVAPDTASCPAPPLAPEVHSGATRPDTGPDGLLDRLCVSRT